MLWLEIENSRQEGNKDTVQGTKSGRHANGGISGDERAPDRPLLTPPDLPCRPTLIGASV